MTFWQFCWGQVKSLVIRYLEEFSELGSFERSLNIAFMVLSPRERVDLKFVLVLVFGLGDGCG